MSADLAVIIVSYNTISLLRACLRALTAALALADGIGGSRERAAPAARPDLNASPWDASRFPILVVDNGSTDGSAEMVAREFPSVGLRALGENRGFAAANNLGLREVDAPYVLFLNPDTEVLGDAPLALLRFMRAHPSVGVCSGRLLYPDLRFQHSCFHFPTLLMSFLDFFPINHRLIDSRLNGRYPRRWYQRAFPIDHPLGACMLVRRETIEQVGGFDEGYFMYCEEVDWCYRIKQAGWQIYYCPDAEIVHHAGASSRQNAAAMLVQLHQSRDRFFRRHYGPLFAWAARQIVRVGMADAARRARRAARAGEIDAAELQHRLRLYAEVSG